MKLIYLTDSHFQMTGPESRDDDYFEACKRKLQWLIEYAYENKIRYILHGGDVFNHARPGFGTINPIAQMISNTAEMLDFYINVGNHDLYGWNPETFPRTALQMLGLLSNVHILGDNEVKLIMPPDCMTVAIHAIWSKFDREGDSTIFKFPEVHHPHQDGPDILRITMAHTMLVERSFFGSYVAMDQIEWGQAADLILGSHYHPGWPITVKNTSAGRRILAHPGSFMRIMKAVEPRMPQILVIEVGSTPEALTVTPVVVEVAEPWPFKEEAEMIPESEVMYGPIFENFLDQLLSSSIDASAFDPRMLATTIANEQGIPEGVLKRVIKNLDAVSKETNDGRD